MKWINMLATVDKLSTLSLLLSVHHCIQSSPPPHKRTEALRAKISQRTKDHTDITTTGQKMDLDISSPTAE